MSRKNTLPYPIAIGQSLSASFSSVPTVVQNTDNISYQIDVFTTDSTGTFQVQVSNDYNVVATTGQVTNPGTWVSLDLGGGTPTVAAANDTIVIALTQLPYYAIRIHYTATIAGTGTCNIYFLSKQIGG